MSFIEKNSNSSIRGLFNEVVRQMTGNGDPLKNEITDAYFTFLDYADYATFETASNSGTNHVILKPTSLIDPMITGSEIYTWGLTMFIDNNQLKASWGVMKADGSAGGQITNVSGFSGAINGSVSGVSSGTAGGCIAELSAGRYDDLFGAGEGPSGNTDNDGTFPPNNSNLHGFGLKMTDHGFGLVVYHQTKVRNWKQFGTLVIQRPVKNDGTTLVKVSSTDKAPLFAVWNNLDYGKDIDDPVWYSSVVMEDDVSYSSPTFIFKDYFESPVGSTSDFYSRYDRYKQPDKYALIDFESTRTLYRLPTGWDLPLTQDNKEVPLVFPFGLTTNRNVYLENMDIICVGPSSVFTFGQDITINVFGNPGQQREYKVYNASKDCKGVVVALLKDIL